MLVAEIEEAKSGRDGAAAAETNGDLPVGWKRLVVRYLDGRLLKGLHHGLRGRQGSRPCLDGSKRS